MKPPRHYIPKPYQPLMTNHMIDVPRCAVWCGMGGGKSVATLTALLAILLTEGGRVLILAPLRVARDTWPEETKKWHHTKHLDIMPIVGSETERLAALRYDNPISTCNYENLPWLIEHLGDRWPFTIVVADESTRLKSLRLSYRTSKTGKQFLAGQGGKRTRALGTIAHTKIKRFIQLTGTPASNGLKDLWGCVWFLDAGARLGRTHTAFMQRWFKTDYDGYGTVAMPHAQEQIQDALRDLCITVDPKDWFDLKEPFINNVYVTLPAKARALYREMEKEMFVKLEEHGIEAANAAVLTGKLLQIANGAVYIDEKHNWKEIHDAKIQAVESIISETDGVPLLVAYNFKSDLARLQRAFPKAVLLSDPAGAKAFKAGSAAMGLGHAKSIGHGYDGLQEHCWNIVFFGHDWNLEEYQQIIERVGPMRQEQSGHGDRLVTIHHIIARDTVDEMVMERRASKREVQDILLDAMKRGRKQ